MLDFWNEQKKFEQITFSSGECYSKVSPDPHGYAFHVANYLIESDFAVLLV